MSAKCARDMYGDELEQWLYEHYFGGDEESFANLVNNLKANAIRGGDLLHNKDEILVKLGVHPFKIANLRREILRHDEEIDENRIRHAYQRGHHEGLMEQYALFPNQPASRLSSTDLENIQNFHRVSFRDEGVHEYKDDFTFETEQEGQTKPWEWGKEKEDHVNHRKLYMPLWRSLFGHVNDPNEIYSPQNPMMVIPRETMHEISGGRIGMLTGTPDLHFVFPGEDSTGQISFVGDLKKKLLGSKNLSHSKIQQASYLFQMDSRHQQCNFVGRKPLAVLTSMLPEDGHFVSFFEREHDEGEVCRVVIQVALGTIVHLVRRLGDENYQVPDDDALLTLFQRIDARVSPSECKMNVAEVDGDEDVRMEE